MSKAYLVLSDGTVYEGVGFGAEKEGLGELVFTTGVVGYIETLTDPSCAGQMILQTFPLIGNYGINASDFEGDVHACGYIVREWCDAPSNFRCETDLDHFLKERGVPGICGVDTRAITRKIREQGVMNALICREIPKDLSAIQAFAVAGAVSKVSCKAPKGFAAQGKCTKHVALMDFGAKRSLIRELQKQGCEVAVLPADTSAEAILKMQPDGVVLSGGPGNPAENADIVAQIRALLGKVPMFGTGLGHQLLALAAGGRTEKMKCGHRGANQPVKEVGGTRTLITSQNHGYQVVSDSVGAGKIRFINANDDSCEGIDYPELNAFSVQFDPVSDQFNQFMSMMGGDLHAAE